MTSEQHYYYGLGRRKSAVARVRLYPGNGNIIVNGKPVEEVITRPSVRQDLMRPLSTTETGNRFNVQVKVQGGGISGWAGAIRLGIARALLKADPEYRPVLKKAGLLTRDPRAVERKKYGHHKARKRPQYSKR